MQTQEARLPSWTSYWRADEAIECIDGLAPADEQAIIEAAPECYDRSIILSTVWETLPEQVRAHIDKCYRRGYALRG